MAVKFLRRYKVQAILSRYHTGTGDFYYVPRFFFFKHRAERRRRDLQRNVGPYIRVELTEPLPKGSGSFFLPLFIAE